MVGAGVERDGGGLAKGVWRVAFFFSSMTWVPCHVLPAVPSKYACTALFMCAYLARSVSDMCVPVPPVTVPCGASRQVCTDSCRRAARCLRFDLE